MDLTVAGCNYRCPYCPNEGLIHHYIPMEKHGLEEIVKILRPRLGFLDGISISGGEPLLHRELIDFLKEIKYIGAKVQLKTNASRSKLVRVLIDKKLVDYFSVFIPAPFSAYKDVVNYDVDLDELFSSIRMIRRSNIDHEFRVKPVPGIIGRSELLEIAHYLVGSPRFVIEKFDPGKAMNPLYRSVKPYSSRELDDLRALVSPFFNEVLIQA